MAAPLITPGMIETGGQSQKPPAKASKKKKVADDGQPYFKASTFMLTKERHMRFRNALLATDRQGQQVLEELVDKWCAKVLKKEGEVPFWQQPMPSIEEPTMADLDALKAWQLQLQAQIEAMARTVILKK